MCASMSRRVAKSASRQVSQIESGVTGNLKPWREVVTPHKDVASGRYQQAEFAADLWQVHLGEGTDEYKNPVEFFRRTYLTESLKGMLVGAVRRLTAGGGDPVVQLQTNFGGGKTHSMLALYHLFSGITPNRTGRHRRSDAGGRSNEAARRLGAWCWWATRFRPATLPPSRTAQWCARCGVNWPGSSAARRPLLVSGRRREGHQPRRCAARAVQRVWPVPDPDRRMGGLCAPAPRPERSARGRLRDAVHLRPGADRIGEAGEELPAGNQPSSLGYHWLAARPGR